MISLILFAFLSGIITILAPCIWPLLPLLLSASVGKGKWRPLGIVFGIVVSFTFFTLFLAYLLSILPIPPDVFRNIAVIIIIFLGLTLLIPVLNRTLESWVSRLSGKLGGSQKERKGFGGGCISGLLLGTLWTPCAGPILAVVATLAATRSVTIEAFFITLAFAVGVGIPLFVIAQLGQNFFVKSRKVSPYTARIQQVFGAIMIVVAVLIFFGYDKTLQARILDIFPSYGNALYFLEESDTAREKLDELRDKNDEDTDKNKEIMNSQKNQAPEFSGIETWLNSDALTMQDLRGKVVLIDFWTYSCINCIRTLPYVTDWYESYKDQGFVVVGVHTPEFAFEREVKNVERALDRYDITYPVALDNEYRTWRAYENRYWPAHYLIDVQGNIRYTHFGEGEYEKTEGMIRDLLEEAGMEVKNAVVGEKEETLKSNAMRRTPEMYLGAERMEYHFPEHSVVTGRQTFPVNRDILVNRFSYGGTWNVGDERAESEENASIILNFSGAHVFLVMSPPESGKGSVKVLLDGEGIRQTEQGKDTQEGKIIVDEDRLYEVVDLKEAGEHTLELQFETPGIRVFAFTFG